MSLKVNYSDFDPARVIFPSVEKPESKAAKVVYYRIPIRYMYQIKRSDGTIGEQEGPLYIQGPMEKSNGPTEKVFDDNGSGEPAKTTWSVMTKYDMNNPEQSAFIGRNPAGTIHKMVLRCIEKLFEVRGEIKMNARTLDQMIQSEGTQYYYPVRWTLDESGNPAPGKNPAGMWKLFRYGKDPSNMNESSFYYRGTDGKTTKIPWDMLSNCVIEHVPIFKIENITVASGRASIKMFMASSVVYKITPRSSMTFQDELIQTQDMSVASEIENTLRELQMAKGMIPKASTNNYAPPVLHSGSGPIPGMEIEEKKPVSEPVPIPVIPTTPPVMTPIAPPTVPVVSSVPIPDLSTMAPPMMVAPPVMAPPPVMTPPPVMAPPPMMMPPTGFGHPTLN